MNRAIIQFRTNIEAARQLEVIYQALVGQVTRAIPLEELLRAEVVLAVSALDCYVHDIVRICMTDVFSLGAGESNAFLGFNVSLDFVKKALRSSTPTDREVLFEQEIRRLHGYRTFQRPPAISEALSFIGMKKVWVKIANNVGRAAEDIQEELKLIIERRDRIAHEGDIDPSAGFALKYPIDLTTVQTSVAFIETIVNAIQAVVISEAPSMVDT